MRRNIFNKEMNIKINSLDLIVFITVYLVLMPLMQYVGHWSISFMFRITTTRKSSDLNFH